MLNPLNSNKIYLRFYLSVWGSILVIHAIVIYYIGGVNWQYAFTDSLVYNALFSLAGLGIWYIVRYTRLDSDQVFNTVISHLAASILLVAIWLYLSRSILLAIFQNDTVLELFQSETALWRGIIGLLYYTIITFSYYLVQYYSDYQQQKLKESETNRLLKETELSALKSQINPHFIFNSLNSISALTLSKPEKAQEMVINLSSFLRYTLSPTSRQLIHLKDELEAVKLYLEIEKVRFGEKLSVDIKCDTDSQELKLPQLILQPLVENAIKYGVYESTGDNRIVINCSHKSGFLTVEVENDIESGGVPPKGQGIGLKNVKSRLELVYENPELMTIKKSENKYAVKITFPQ